MCLIVLLGVSFSACDDVRVDSAFRKLRRGKNNLNFTDSYLACSSAGFLRECKRNRSKMLWGAFSQILPLQIEDCWVRSESLEVNCLERVSFDSSSSSCLYPVGSCVIRWKRLTSPSFRDILSTCASSTQGYGAELQIPCSTSRPGQHHYSDTKILSVCLLDFWFWRRNKEGVGEEGRNIFLFSLGLKIYLFFNWIQVEAA